MKTGLCSLLIILVVSYAAAQTNTAIESQPDSLTIRDLPEVIITAMRNPSILKMSTQSVSLVTSLTLGSMPKSIGAEEALHFVPGVRIDNQADGSRIHMSIRGQGILSERGLRGIRVLLDGIPVNDPSGFAPDLYDVDWATVSRIEVLKGPSASIYGGGGAAGVLNIKTEAGGTRSIGGMAEGTIGSDGFYKVLGQINGTGNNLEYRISYSRLGGDGYRDHAAYWGNNFSEKLVYNPDRKINLTQVFSVTDYFNQNAEGLSIEQVRENPKQANPDACPFNEYQKTNRMTGGLSGTVRINSSNDIQFYGFIRYWKYKETSNKAAQYRYYTTPGGSLLYNLRVGQGKVKNTLSLGTDFQFQSIREMKFKSRNDTLREESISEENLEDTLMLANQVIHQKSAGLFLFDKLDIGKHFTANVSVRYDYMYNELDDYMRTAYNASGSMEFDQVTGRVGAAYSFSPGLTLFASWSTGFLPPATEELASNPEGYGGFNENLKPATSMCEELGVRGFIGDRLYYDVTGFYMTTKDDFFRFKLTPARGNQEVFYGNVGNTRRIGIETYVNYSPIRAVKFQGAYTFSDFRYTSPDSLEGQFIPNSPVHQLSIDGEWRITKNFTLGMTYDMQSKWYIYTDVIHNDVSQDGFNLLGARFLYNWKLSALGGEIGLFVKNIFNTEYIAFTEPDPDGNCYQPAPGRQFYLTVRFKI